MKKYQWKGKGEITRTKTFEKKEFALFAANCGLKCDHSCTYCSSGTMGRMHEVFKRLGLNPFENHYAILDLNAPERLARDARQKQKRGMVQLCTIPILYSCHHCIETLQEIGPYASGRQFKYHLIQWENTFRRKTAGVSVAKQTQSFYYGDFIMSKLYRQIRYGAVSAAIRTDTKTVDGKEASEHTIRITRYYKQDGTSKEKPTNKFSLEDLPKVRLAVNQAYALLVLIDQKEQEKADIDDDIPF